MCFVVIAVIVLAVSERAFFWSTNSTFFGPRVREEEKKLLSASFTKPFNLFVKPPPLRSNNPPCLTF